MNFFEDIAIGETRQIGSHTFAAEEIKRFATAFDPQPFHMNEADAARSHFGGLCASGWHTLAIWMKLNVRDLRRRDEELVASGDAPAKLGPSPGFDDLKWLKPVYAGDTISFTNQIVAKRASKSRLGWGLVTLRSFGHNQAGEEVLSFIGHVFVERRKSSASDQE